MYICVHPWHLGRSSFSSSIFVRLPSKQKMEALRAIPRKTDLHIRSTSLPTKFTTTIEEELVKLRQSKDQLCCSTPKADNICVGLFALCKVYDCVKEQLQLPLTQQFLHHHKQEMWVDQIMDASIRVADMSGSTRELLVTLKECLTDLQSLLRIGRIEQSCQAYICAREKVKKNVNKCISRMKLFKNVNAIEKADFDQKIVSVLGELEEMANFILRLILTWIGTPKKNSLIAKIVKRKTITFEGDDLHASEVDLVDHVVSCLSTSQISMKTRDSQKKLQELEDRIVSLEEGLQCLSRHLIQTRASLLNIFT